MCTFYFENTFQKFNFLNALVGNGAKVLSFENLIVGKSHDSSKFECPSLVVLNVIILVCSNGINGLNYVTHSPSAQGLCNFNRLYPRTLK